MLILLLSMVDSYFHVIGLCFRRKPLVGSYIYRPTHTSFTKLTLRQASTVQGALIEERIILKNVYLCLCQLIYVW